MFSFLWKGGGVMYHEEILAKAAEYRAGHLDPGERESVDWHLEKCRDCRQIVSRWRLTEPPRDFADKVMESVSPLAGWIVANGWLRRFPFWGTVAAAALVGTAFWHPEKQWIDLDQSFAWNNQPALSAAHPCAPVSNKERGLP